MSQSHENAGQCVDEDRTLTPISPFLGLNYHFGMLLGVDDFDTEQAYHRGKMRLHNAWLHREGVVWGLEVKLDAAKNEVRVVRGLALDAAGHELHLEADACVNLGAWFEQHQGDEGFEVTENNGEFTFDAHVLISHRACLTRQVPALSQPCDGSSAATAYSRVFETVELLLVPGPAPEPPAPVNHALRLLFGLDAPRTVEDDSIDPVDQAILDARAAVAAVPPDQQGEAWSKLFRQLAAADEMEMSPAQDPDTGETLLFPALDRTPLLLAEIKGITLKKNGDNWTTTAGTVHNEVRAAHVPTRTIQELLVAKLSSPPASEDGPRIDPDTVSFGAAQVTFEVNRDLHTASVQPTAFAVSSFDTGTGWQTATISSAAYDASTKAVTLTLSAALGGALHRLVVFGANATPLLDTELKPLAGALHDPPAQQGRDFIFTHKV